MHLSKPALLFGAWASTACARSVQQDVFQDDAAYKHLDLTHDLFALHKNLTQIESISGNEKEVGEWLTDSLVSQGYHVEKQVVSKDPLRFNVHAWPGSKRDAEVLISSHIDTVPPFYGYKRHSDKTISGRGSVDAKGSVAAQVIAANNLLADKKIHPDDIALLYVVGEEVGGDGMQTANDLELKPQAIIFGEPTEGKLASGHKGMLSFKITVKGKAAHSGYPWLGLSANEVIVTALAALMELGANLPEDEKFGKTTINLGTIKGGVAHNVVAESAEAGVAIRIAQGTPASMKNETTHATYTAISKFLKDGQKPADIIDIAFSGEGYSPVDIDADVPGFETMIVNYGTDIPNLDKSVEGQKRYLYGPGTILVAHSDHEAITEEQLESAVGGYEKLILHSLGKKIADNEQNFKESL
ncbi:hypothetical protein Q7P37_002979 [Cladosporium fusiforme]